MGLWFSPAAVQSVHMFLFFLGGGGGGVAFSTSCHKSLTKPVLVYGCDCAHGVFIFYFHLLQSKVCTCFLVFVVVVVCF